MPNIKISDLPAADTITGTELVPVVQNGTSKKASVAALNTISRDHAAIYIYDGAYAQSIPNGSTPVLIAHFAQAGGDNGLSSGAVPDKASNRIVAAKSGRYLVQYSLSYTCNQNNVTWESYVFANGARLTDTGAMSKLSTGADTQCISGVGIADLVQGQAIDLRAYHNYGSAVNLTVSHASLTLIQLSDA